MSLLDASLYGAIRGAIDTSLTDESLPDRLIELSIYGTAGELDLLALDPAAETRTGAARTYVRNALVFLIAARIVRAMPQLITERLGEVSYSRNQVNPDKRAQALYQQALQQLGNVLSVTEDVVFFATVHGTRGR